MNISVEPNQNCRSSVLNVKSFMHFLAKAHTAIQEDEERFTCLIDLRRFKAINDVHGQEAGDLVLDLIQQRMLSILDQDDIIGHLGGDHFLIFFNRLLAPLEVEKVLSEISLEIEKSIVFKASKIFVGCNIAVTKWCRGISTKEMLRQLNKALSKASSLSGSGISWYSKKLERDAVERVLIEPELREAVANHTIEPWFQPIFQLDNLKLRGFEVLARWSHSSHGKIAPGRFIQTAESCNLIDELSMNIFREACFIAQKIDQDLTISFNISPLQFYREELVSEIKVILEESGLAPHRLTLEITESSAIRDLGATKKKLKALKAIGIEIALDDFGTGYSSLTNLGHLPIDRIKIDRHFIIDIATKPHNQKIVRGIIALANGLGVAVTIEGIETPSDLAFAQRHGSFLGQGFLFDRAMPVDQVELYLKSKWSHGYIGKSVQPISQSLLGGIKKSG